MFSLVITLISIALASALAIAAVYYGGSAYLSAQVNADATKLVNQGMQVKAAAEYHRLREGKLPATMGDMVEGGYLKEGLSSSSWTTQDGYALVTNVQSAQCLAANQQLGVPGVPSCDDPQYADRPVCCELAAVPPPPSP